MKRTFWALLLGMVIAVTGCTGANNPTASGTGAGAGPPGETDPGEVDPGGGEPGGGAGGDGEANPGDGLGPYEPIKSPVPIQDNAVEFHEGNTVLTFVGTKPDGTRHTGGFGKFSGKITLADGAVSAVTVTFKTDSLFADNRGLARHLKSEDFFSVNEHPEAKFESTKVEPGGADGGVSITGNLTLLGSTKEVTVPAKVAVADDKLSLDAKFEIDRTQFGMTFGEGQVDKQVSIEVNVGTLPDPDGSPGGGGGGGAAGGGPPPPGSGSGGAGGGRRGRNFDPVAMFKENDKNKDGKLSGDEIPERMQQRIDVIDADKDGAITLKEIQDRMRQRQLGGGGRGGRGRRPGGDGGGRSARPGAENGEGRPARPASDDS